MVAVIAGAFAVLTGPEGQLGGDGVNANVESEYRFYAALWVGYGAVALRFASRAGRAPGILFWLMGVLFAAGLARVVALIAAGKPDAPYLVLMALELAIPPALVLVQRRAR